MGSSVVYDLPCHTCSTFDEAVYQIAEPSKTFLGKVLAKKSKILPGGQDLARRPRSCQEAKILPGGQDLARRLRSCHILGKILAKILARNWPAIILAPWTRSWASLGQVGQDLGQVGQDLGQESCPRTFCWGRSSCLEKRDSKASRPWRTCSNSLCSPWSACPPVAPTACTIV